MSFKLMGRQFRFERRENLPLYIRILTPAVSVLLAFVFCAIFLKALEFDPVQAYTKMFNSVFGNWIGFTKSITQAIPLMLCGLGVAISFKMNLRNIGGEGQMMMGAFAATGVALYHGGAPDWTIVPLMFLAAFLTGALWAIIATLPKALWNVNETIITLMMNYVALLFVDYLIYGPWRDTTGSIPMSYKIPEYTRFFRFGNTQIHAGIIIAVMAAIIIYLFFRLTTQGYQIKVIGSGMKTAQYAGMDIRSNILLVMLFSGGLCGLAGLSQVAGVTDRLQPSIASGAGFTGIIIAYLSKFNPLAILIVSILFGALHVSGYSMQLMQVPTQIVTVIQNAILLFVLGGEIFTRYKLSVFHVKEGAKSHG